MKQLYGNLEGLKTDQKRRLEHLYRRKESSEFIVSPELCHEMAALSHEIDRQIGVLINRQGKLLFVIVGDSHQIVIPSLPDHRVIPGRLLGLKCVHTHLNAHEPLSQDDLTDLALLRFDLMAAITLLDDGRPHQIHWGHIRPESEGEPYIVLPPVYPGGLKVSCQDIIRKTEADLTKNEALYEAEGSEERAILVSVSTEPRETAMDSLDELKELARSSRITVLDTVLQMRKKPDPRYLMGSGKLSELTILSMQKGASMLIFDQELNPSQIRSITDQVEIKVIDRTQMILDIFARRAQTKEGKLQVELAQLKYLLPRLVTKNTAMSRLTGGIGGRGPGETKLELNRRRVHDRINRLQKALDQVIKQRGLQKSMRKKKGIPVISIVGYTNAGKSTLLNALTQSQVLAEDQLFATLDPSSRRLRFPADIEVIITDTVGFIRNLPKELMVSFRATLEELENADILLHVIDISNPRFHDQIQSVVGILKELELDRIPTLNVLNKCDRVPPEIIPQLSERYQGIPICAQDRASIMPLLIELEKRVEPLILPEIGSEDET